MFREIKQLKEHITTNFYNVNSMFLQPVNAYDVLKQINLFRTNCASGVNGVTTNVIKYSYTFFFKPLEHIINLIFKSGEVPEHFKKTVITPIFKVGSRAII